MAEKIKIDLACEGHCVVTRMIFLQKSHFDAECEISY